MIRIAHISDPHFGTTRPEKISALLKSIHDHQPHIVLLSGDITQRAKIRQFYEARKFCDALKPIDVIATPGNHDIPLLNLIGRFFWPYFGFKKVLKFPIFTQRKINSEIELIVLNTTDRKRYIQGFFSEKDINALSNFSQDSKVRIVMFHHPLDCAKKVDEKNIVENAKEVLPFFEKAQIDLVLGGHIHDPLSRLSNVRYPNSKRPFAITLAGTCLSSRIRSGAPNSYNLIDIKTNSDDVNLDITRLDLTSDNIFVPINQMSFKRSGRDQWKPLK